MSLRIVQDRLDRYRAKNSLEEENALKEITQEIALSGLSRAGLFKRASFQGGTCLRIIYGLNRFSEDLDFVLHRSDATFRWSPYLTRLRAELETYGYQIEIQDRSEAGVAVQVGFLKEDSIGQVLHLTHAQSGPRRALRIKLEVDTHPPRGATREQKYLNFPVVVPVVVHDLASLFAGKSHALLCRKWEKGRDWYDFVWYVSQKTNPNWELLARSLFQTGPWAGKKLRVDAAWYLDHLKARIESTDWERQRKDVARFLKASDQDLLRHWGKEFFLEQLSALRRTL